MSTTEITNAIPVKPSQLIEALQYCDKSNIVPFILAPAGVGKTEITHEFSLSRARGVGRYCPIYLGQHSPTDLCGFPHIDRETNRMRFSIPMLLPTEPFSVVHLDEITNAPKLNQNLSLQIARERRIGEWVAPEGTMIILSGNGRGHRCHTEATSAAMANRIMFLHLIPDLDDWTQWAIANACDVRVIAFLRFRPDLLHSFDASKWDGESGFASPRSWAAVASLIAQEPPGYLRLLMLQGLIGPGAAAEFNAFLSVYEQTPSVDSILLDPAGSDVPDEPSARYAVCAALSNRASKDNFSRVLTYLARLPKEFEAFGVRLMVRMNDKLKSTKDFIGWAVDNKDVML